MADFRDFFEKYARVTALAPNSMEENPLDAVRRTLEPFGINMPEPSQNAFLPQGGWFGRHPKATSVLENVLLAAASIPDSNTIGEGIGNVAQSIIGMPALKQQLQFQRLAGPMAFAGQLNQMGMVGLQREKLMAEIAGQPDVRALRRSQIARNTRLANQPYPTNNQVFPATKGTPPYMVDKDTGALRFLGQNPLAPDAWSKDLSPEGKTMMERLFNQIEKETGNPLTGEQKFGYLVKLQAQKAGASAGARGEVPEHINLRLGDADKMYDDRVEDINRKIQATNSASFMMSSEYKSKAGTPAQRKSAIIKDYENQKSTLRKQRSSYRDKVLRGGYQDTFENFMQEAQPSASPLPATPKAVAPKAITQAQPLTSPLPSLADEDEENTNDLDPEGLFAND